ncbi:trypsin-like peptidase domain-containing protein [Colwellia sp. MSW7]|uniref:Trypsin-like peptidase domain-containing protein n=1 Tax=Colwellia maritima TaxID=2912588 RepID=A0ABS9WYD2_9GAMM|nr:trypsin-like peptidase domain-containing protein [Colwellia maritima]MCI2283010.1 trypsin-like peptidase domain-containing protein [Colwellia maritima]
MVKSGAPINTTSTKYNTPLNQAIISFRFEITKYLLNNGAKIDHVGPKANTALHYATLSQKADLFKLIMHFKPNVNAVNREGNTPLIMAVMKNKTNMLNELLSAGASVNVQNIYGDTALHWAINKKNVSLIKALVSFGADPYLHSAASGTAMHMAKNDYYIQSLLQRPIPPAKEKIKKPNKGELIGTGSGFVINDLGYIITNYHVVEGCNGTEVFSNSTQYPARVVHVDKHNDLAVLKVNLLTDDYVHISNKEVHDLGEEVVVLGYPLISLMGNTIKLTTGSLSALSGLGGDSSNYQISAPIQPGNSGGPVFDSTGAVIGVIVSKLSDSYMLKSQGNVPQNVNFAIKSNILKAFLKANKVKYHQSSRSNQLRAKDIYKLNENAVKMLLCFN